MGTSDTMTCYVALEPDATGRRFFERLKERVRSLVGPQPYLNDPPHVTLYAACFGDVASVRRELPAIAEASPAVSLEMAGWDVFWSDKLTGNHTLVCKPAPFGAGPLFALQERIVARLGPIRDVEQTRKRFEPVFAALDDGERLNVGCFGFPYVGANWSPHVTLASIEAARWSSLGPWQELELPTGGVTFPSLGLFAMVPHGTSPILRARLNGEPS
jgi:hypothetical protein